jgi:hypothetical protein
LVPYHPALLDALRVPATSAPLRILVSGCLAGFPCGVDGSDNGMGGQTNEIAEPDIHGGDGVDVIAGRARVFDEPRRQSARLRALALLRERLDPGYVRPSDALDHHEHPWTREHLPAPHPRGLTDGE